MHEGELQLKLQLAMIHYALATRITDSRDRGGLGEAEGIQVSIEAVCERGSPRVPHQLLLLLADGANPVAARLVLCVEVELELHLRFDDLPRCVSGRQQRSVPGRARNHRPCGWQWPGGGLAGTGWADDHVGGQAHPVWGDGSVPPAYQAG